MLQTNLSVHEVLSSMAFIAAEMHLTDDWHVQYTVSVHHGLITVALVLALPGSGIRSFTRSYNRQWIQSRTVLAELLRGFVADTVRELVEGAE